MNIETSKAEFTSYSSSEWIVDFDSGNNGEPSASLEAVAQDVRFALDTERYCYPIMGANFGVSLLDLVGADYSYIRSEVARRIRDALSIDDRILSIDDFTFDRLDDAGLSVSCTITTIFGNIQASTSVGA